MKWAMRTECYTFECFDSFLGMELRLTADFFEFDWSEFFTLLALEEGSESEKRALSCFFLLWSSDADDFFEEMCVLLSSALSSVSVEEVLFLCRARRNWSMTSSSSGTGIEAKCSAMAAANSDFGTDGFILIWNCVRYFLRQGMGKLSKSTTLTF